jgi:hypothetical protein
MICARSGSIARRRASRTAARTLLRNKSALATAATKPSKPRMLSTPGEVVAERHQAPFATNLVEAADQEVAVVGAAFERAEGMLDNPRSAAHQVGSALHARAVTFETSSCSQRQMVRVTAFGERQRPFRSAGTRTKKLARTVPVTLSVRAKAELGYALLDGTLDAPVFAEPVMMAGYGRRRLRHGVGLGGTSKNFAEANARGVGLVAPACPIRNAPIWRFAPTCPTVLPQRRDDLIFANVI